MIAVMLLKTRRLGEALVEDPRAGEETSNHSHLSWYVCTRYGHQKQWKLQGAPLELAGIYFHLHPEHIQQNKVE
jgi:hypothetical protein